MGSKERTGTERLLDFTLYAPLGLALEFRRMYPDLAERGRRQVHFTRALGRAAVNRGGEELRRRLHSQEEAIDDVDGMGVDGEASTGDSADEAGAEMEPVQLRPDPAALAIADYDSLSAQHVVKRLDALSPRELEAVRVYEDAGRGRRTILTRIAQLQV